jgi:hypothetical protein
MLDASVLAKRNGLRNSYTELWTKSQANSALKLALIAALKTCFRRASNTSGGERMGGESNRPGDNHRPDQILFGSPDARGALENRLDVTGKNDYVDPVREEG